MGYNVPERAAKIVTSKLIPRTQANDSRNQKRLRVSL